MHLKVTPVFEKNWNAINAKNPDGSRKYRYIINTGSSRSSKTYSLIDCCDLYSRQNPDTRFTIWRSTKKDCKDTVMNDFLKRLRITDRYSMKYHNKTESFYNYTNYSRVEFRGADEDGIFGLTQGCAWLNEPYSISKDDFDQIDQRTSDFIFIDWNPKEDHWIDELSKHPRALVIHSTFKDNPFIPEESRLKILSYEPTEENIANGTANKYKWDVFGLGIKGEIEGLAFTDWEIVDIPIDKYGVVLKLYGHGLDFGYTNDPTSFISHYQYKGSVLFDEVVYTTNLRMGQLADLIKPYQKDLIIADRSEPLYIDELVDLGFKNIWAAEGDKSIVNGIELMKDQKFYVSSRSKNLIRELENYKNKKNKFGKFMNIPDDGQEDHAIDAARYIHTDYKTKNIKHSVI